MQLQLSAIYYYRFLKSSILLMFDYMFTTSFILIFTLVTLTYFLYFRVVKPYKLYSFYKKVLQAQYKTYVEPFNPFSSPLIKRWKSDFYNYGDNLYTSKNVYSQCSVVLSAFRQTVFLRLIDPQLIKQFIQKSNQGCYQKTFNSPFTASLRFVIGQGLILSQGDQWKNKRKIMTTVFNYDFIKSKIAAISKITRNVLDTVESRSQNESKREVKMDVDLTLQEIFGNVVVKCFFGNIQLEDIQGEPLFNFFRRMSEENVERALTTYALTVGPKFIDLNLRSKDRQIAQMCKTFNKYVEAKIQNYLTENTESRKQSQGVKADKEQNGVIELLLSQNKLKEKADQSQPKDYYTVQDLIDEFKNFLFAGTDTTSNSTAVLIYQIAKNKEIEKKLRQQIREVIGDDLQNITFQKLKAMKYLQNCFKETLRMYSAVPSLFSREAIQDHYIGKIPIKKGMVIVASLISNHYKQQFTKNPLIFNPDRWDEIDLKKKDPYLYFPFSAGKRNCIGQHLAQLQSKILIINMLSRYKEIILQKSQIRYKVKVTYGAERMITTFVK